jgi:hypothetical protein
MRFFVLDAGNVHGGQIAGAQQACDLDGVSPIVLDLVAGPFRDQGGSNYTAVETLAGEVSIQDVAGGAGLVSEHQVFGFGVKPANDHVDVTLTSADAAHGVRWLGLAARGVSDRNGILVDVQTDEKRSKLRHG